MADEAVSEATQIIDDLMDTHECNENCLLETFSTSTSIDYAMATNASDKVHVQLLYDELRVVFIKDFFLSLTSLKWLLQPVALFLGFSVLTTIFSRSLFQQDLEKISCCNISEKYRFIQLL